MTKADYQDAVQIAVAAGVVKFCPLHPKELVLVGNEQDLPEIQDGRQYVAVREIIAEAPTVCPRCLDRDDG